MATNHNATATAATTTTASGRHKGLLRRTLEAAIEARLRRAEFEVQAYHHPLPSELERAGLRVNQRNEDSLPFAG